MYKIHKDADRQGKFRLQYFLLTNLIDPLYTIENLTWEDTERFIKNTQIDHNDLLWVYDIINLLDKQIHITDAGTWAVL